MRNLIVIILALFIGIAGITFRVTHHPIYKGCRHMDVGYSCTLTTWKGNK